MNESNGHKPDRSFDYIDPEDPEARRRQALISEGTALELKLIELDGVTKQIDARLAAIKDELAKVPVED